MGRLSGEGPGRIAPGGDRIVNLVEGGEIIRTIQIKRTERPYAYDLCDAYNATMRQDARDNNQEWFVDEGGQIKLGDSAAYIERKLAKARRFADQWYSSNA